MKEVTQNRQAVQISKPILLAASLLLPVGLSACTDDSGGGGSDREVDQFNFTNTVTKEELGSKLDELSRLGSRASDLSVINSGGSYSLKEAYRFAGLIDEGSDYEPNDGGSYGDAQAGAIDCDSFSASMPLQYSVDFSPSQGDQGLQLDAETDCGSALKSLKSYYSNALGSLMTEVARFKQLKPGEDKNYDQSLVARSTLPQQAINVRDRCCVRVD